MSDIKKGDRVRVTFEAEVVDDYYGGAPGCICTTKGLINKKYLKGLSVEKLEPPVEVFKAGDVVRDRSNFAWRYLLTNDGGYTELDSGYHYTDGHFTSESYEKVKLVEAPF